MNVGGRGTEKTEKGAETEGPSQKELPSPGCEAG